MQFYIPTVRPADHFEDHSTAKHHSLGKENRFKTHNSPRPPQTPAASFKRLYRKCPGPTSRQNPTFACRSTSDKDLTFQDN
jgi:hypothetical protein